MTEPQAAVETSDEFELVNREDEEQILAELRGVPVDKFIYKNKRNIFELTYSGTKWAVRKMAEKGETIRIDQHPRVEKCVIDPEYITVTVLAKRVLVDRDSKAETILDTTIGSARNWIKQRLSDGKVIPDEHFFSKAVSRATRNAQQSLMPQDFKKEVIDALVKMQGGGAAPARPAPKGTKPSAPASAPSAAPAKPPVPPPASSAPAAPAAPPAAPPKAGVAPPKAPAPQKAPAAPPAGKAPAPAVPNTTKSAPGQAPKDAAMDAMRQRFGIVLKQAAGTQDHTKALALLTQLTGKASTLELSAAEIQELGPLLHKVGTKECALQDGAIRDQVTGEQLYPKVEPQFEPAPEEVHIPEEVPQPQTEEMF